ncbi:hypothetical protein Har1129_10025 [Haloarcula sp. CBA1129]|nr:hypothetical protein Har1129_10025 [Haloarcula sp. CBA1129]
MVSSKRDLVWIELMRYDQRAWTVQQMQERIEQDVHESTVRRVFKSAVESGLMSHEKHGKIYYLN